MQGSQKTGEMVMYDDAASKVSFTINETGREVSAWLTKDGFLYSEEAAAKYAGCTHRVCSSCGKHPVPKVRSICNGCGEERHERLWKDRPEKELDGDEMFLCSETSGEYYQGWDDFLEQLASGFVVKTMSPKDLLESFELVHCEQSQFPELMAEDILADVLPEGEDVPDDILEEFEKLNSFMRQRAPISWQSTSTRVKITDEMCTDVKKVMEEG